MSGLVLKLNPKERVLVNGAVIENGDRRSRVSILTPNANILRMRDALRPDWTSSKRHSKKAHPSPAPQIIFAKILVRLPARKTSLLIVNC